MPAGWYTDGADEAIGHRYVPNMSRENYRKMVEACKEAIYDGEIIQVVVSQRLTRRTAVEPFDLYRSLRAINPSPYMFYLDLDGFQIIGASPELLVQSVDGQVAVHPIAGSRPRGLTRLKKTMLWQKNCSPMKRRSPNTSCFSTWVATT